MRVLPLRPFDKGFFVFVDDSDFDILKKYKWYRTSSSKKRRKPIYAQMVISSRVKMFNLPLHRILVNAKNGDHVDHIDGDTANNTRSNLRTCSNMENKRNTGSNIKNTSGYKGVSYNKMAKKYGARISVNNKFGYFDDKIDAANAYNDAAIKYHGEFAKTNTL
jgi:hypothetical protein